MRMDKQCCVPDWFFVCIHVIKVCLTSLYISHNISHRHKYRVDNILNIQLPDSPRVSSDEFRGTLHVDQTEFVSIFKNKIDPEEANANEENERAEQEIQDFSEIFPHVF